MRDKLSKMAEGAIQTLTGVALQAWVLPSISASVTGIIGWLSSVEWFYVWLGAGFMFVTTTTGLLRFDEWRTRVTARDKLTFSTVRVRKKLSEDGSIGAIGFGFQFRNTAIFPMQFSVQDMQTELMGVYPPKKAYDNDTIAVSPSGVCWFDDHMIELKDVSRKGKLAEGTIFVRLKYGRPENLRHTLKLKKKVFLKFDDRGDVQMGEWYDL